MTALSQSESTVQGQRRKAQVLGALSGGRCHLIVCVDMLGEGFDMPNLKIAAFHDNRRSLGPAIRRVGLLARTQ
jgi:superfamily II DNA/RNA helicase